MANRRIQLGGKKKKWESSKGTKKIKNHQKLITWSVGLFAVATATGAAEKRGEGTNSRRADRIHRRAVIAKKRVPGSWHGYRYGKGDGKFHTT